MSELKRKVNDALNLKLKLEPKDDTLFVQAELTDQNDAVVAPGTVTLTNDGDGIYADDGSIVMPNVVEVRANYFVYYDSGFTEEACEHGGLDIFVKDDFDPSLLQPKITRILAVMRTVNEIGAKVLGPSMVNGTLKTINRVAGMVKSSKIDVKIKTENKIIGEVYD